jgi:2'-5' RNA ligase
MDEKIRCFIAIELSQEIRQVLGRIEDELQGTISGVKWVKPDNIHLTLKFIGSIEEEKVDELSSAGAFPSPGRPRVIWIGIEEGKEESSRLANLVEEKIAPLGIEKESRAFHPHLTLARVKFLKDKSSVENAFAHLKVPQTEMTALKVTLFQSTLAREGAIYTVLHEADFKNTA